MWLLFVFIGALGWAHTNVLDSGLVARYKQHPVVLMWSQSLFTIPILLLIALLFDVRTSWFPLLLLGGGCSYIGDLTFFVVLKRLDVSVTNAAWAILSIFLAAAGFFLFRESWGLEETAGALLILAGTLSLSFWNKHVSLSRTLALLIGLALLQTPYYLLKKAALLDGQRVIAVFFWLLIMRESLAFTLPWSVPSYRRLVLELPRNVDRGLFLIGALVIVCFFVAEYFGALAFQAGPLSLVAIVGNIQPFLVIGLAGLFAHFAPAFAPRELLTAQSLKVKVASFFVVFLGLALLGASL